MTPLQVLKDKIDVVTTAMLTAAFVAEEDKLLTALFFGLFFSVFEIVAYGFRQSLKK